MRSVVSVLAIVLVAGLVWWIWDEQPEVVGPGAGGGESSSEEAGPGLEGRGAPQVTAPARGEEGLEQLTGRVLDERGTPQAGVPVVLLPVDRKQGGAWHANLIHWVVGHFEPTAPLYETRSEASGRFRFERLRPEAWMRVEARPRPPRVGTSLDLPTFVLRRQAIVLVVTEGVSLTGRVVDAAGMGVVAQVGARMRTGPLRGAFAGRQLATLTARTDERGRFRMAALPRGVAELTVYVPGRIRRPFLVAVPTQGELVLRVFEEDAIRIAGRVHTPAGAPVSGATVVAQLRELGSGHALYGIAESDASGRYEMTGLPASSVGKVSAIADGHRPGFYGSGGVETKPGKTIEADIVLVPGVTLQGRVRTEEGRPVAGLTVVVSTADAGYHRVLTDAEGAFALEGLEPGKTVAIFGMGAGVYLPAQKDGTVTGRGLGEARVAVGADGATVDLTALPGLPLDVVVVTSAGEPATGASVELVPHGYMGTVAYRETALTGQAGRRGHCQVDVAPQVQYGVRSRLGREIARLGPLRWDDTPASPLTIALEREQAITGRVEDDGGAPVGDVSVTADERKAGRRCGTCRTGADGAFAFHGLVSGRYRLRARGAMVPEGKPPEVELELTAGARADPVILVVPRPARLAGVAVRADGSPVALTAVKVIQAGGSPMLVAETATDAEGGFAAAVAATGEYVLHVGPVRIPGTWQPGDDLRVVVDAGKPRKATIRVLDSEGRLVPRVHVNVERRHKDGSTSGWPSEIHGGEMAVGWPRGGETVSIQVSQPVDGEGRALNLLPASGAVREGDEVVEIVLAGGRTITGLLLGDGKPLAGVLVRAIRPRTFTRHHPQATTDEAGRFTLVAVPIVEVRLVVTAPEGWLPLPKHVVAPSEDEVELRLTSGGELVVRVLDPDGAPLPGVPVRAWGRHEGTHWRRNESTGADGCARLPGAPAGGTLSLRVDPRKAGHPRVQKEDVPLDEGDVVVRVPRAVWIEGVMADADGAVPPGASVRAQGATKGLDWLRETVRADSKTGRFRVGPLQAGPYKVIARAGRGYTESAPTELDAPARGLRLVVPRRVSLKGRIVGGKPKNGRVRFSLPDTSWFGQIATDGSFEIERLRDEAGTLHARGDTHFALLESVRPSEGPFELRLVIGTTVSGSVPAGTETEGAYVGLERGPIRLFADRFEVGRFEIAAVPPGAWILFLVKDQKHVLRREVLVPEGAAAVTVSFDRDK